VVSKRSIPFTDLIPYLKGQVLQYLSVRIFVSGYYTWGTCGLLCRWPIWSVSQTR